MDTGCTNLGESDEVRNLKKKLLEKESEIESLKHFIGTIKKTADERTSSNEMPISMDDWSTIDVCKWFTTLDLSDYISLVVKNKIDGLLLQNLSNQDWAALGIDNTFHIQKIRLHVRQDRRELSSLRTTVCTESSSSNKSEISHETSDNSEFSIADETSDSEVDDGDGGPTLHMKLLCADPEGSKTKPDDGDIVQIHYSIAIQGSDDIIESSRHTLNRPFEWVCGRNQVIEGWDIAIKTFEGKAHKQIVIPPELAYGESGLKPNVPGNSILVCDIELISIQK